MNVFTGTLCLFVAIVSMMGIRLGATRAERSTTPFGPNDVYFGIGLLAWAIAALVGAMR